MSRKDADRGADPSQRRVAVVERDGSAGLVLARSLGMRGWTVTRLAGRRDLVRFTAGERLDVLLAALDGDEAGVLEMLVRLADAPLRPPVLLLTRRPHAPALGPSSLRALGVDRLVDWPCRVHEVVTVIEEVIGQRRAAAQRAAATPAVAVQQRARLVS